MVCNIENHYYPVGQGGFMYGKISDTNHTSEKIIFDFIYNCGSKSKEGKAIIQKIIEKNFSFRQVIDTLIISHFDGDHINGLEHLSKQVNFKNIILPFLYKEHKILTLIYQIYLDENISEETLKIINDPETELKKFFPNSDISFISPSDNPPPWNNDSDGKKDDSKTEENIQWEKNSDNNKQSYTSIHSNINLKTKKYMMGKDIKWLLYSFMPNLKDNDNIKKTIEKIFEQLKKIPNLKEIIKNLEKTNETIDNKNINDLIQYIQDTRDNKANRKKIEVVFENNLMKSEGKNKEKSIFNRSSVAFYSGLQAQTSSKFIKNYFSCFHKEDYTLPISELIKYNTPYFYTYHYYNRNYKFNDFVEYPRHTFIKNNKYGLLLTGDADLKGCRWRDRIGRKHINNLIKNITTTNLPHHGSKYNTDSQTFETLHNIENFLIFYGINNGHGHPDSEAIENALTAKNVNLVHVTQKNSFHEIIILE